MLKEDRVALESGFPTHTHQNAEIFSYIISGELTHRDAGAKADAKEEQRRQPPRNEEQCHQEKMADLLALRSRRALLEDTRRTSNAPTK